jgi:toxin ParE1/3/4
LKRRAVIIGPDAESDLIRLFEWIAAAASPQIASAYLERLERHLGSLDIASERGVPRDDIRPGLRVVGYQGRITIAFRVEAEHVTILRVFYAGQNWTSQI